MIRWLLNKLLPDDPEPKCGYGPFAWPTDHPFTRACALHDYDFGNAESQEKNLDEANWDLFKRWFLIAQAEQDIQKRMHLVDDMCRGYQLAKKFGYYLWDGK